ncbi:MAG: type II toxin-antitoxin system Phd/YefM family antitoxin [Sulfuritalea sp.]|nr:type II toxin-antitoxin system Phd/YefM family antitoxin [Sulfuritalea sp.]
MHTWQLRDAKSRFSELVNRASTTEGPQLVIRRGTEAVVVIAAPRGEALDTARSDNAVRTLDV